MSKRYEVRIDEGEYRAMQEQARRRGVGSVAEMLRELSREERRVADEVVVFDALSRASEPKVR